MHSHSTSAGGIPAIRNLRIFVLVAAVLVGLYVLYRNTSEAAAGMIVLVTVAGGSILLVLRGVFGNFIRQMHGTSAPASASAVSTHTHDASRHTHAHPD